MKKHHTTSRSTWIKISIVAGAIGAIITAITLSLPYLSAPTDITKLNARLDADEAKMAVMQKQLDELTP